MKQNFIEITAEELAMIVGGLYYGEDEDLSNTEDLIEFLEKHPNHSTYLRVSNEPTNHPETNEEIANVKSLTIKDTESEH